MWAKPWKLKEGLTIGAGLTVTGVFLQAVLGRVEWDFFSSPVNFIALAMYLAALVLVHIFRHKVYLFSWLSGTASAVSSTVWAAGLTAAMGLIRQRSSAMPGTFPGLDQMLSNWSFVLVYVWMMSSLGLALLRVCIPMKPQRIPFLLNHLGLFTAVLCGVLGSADLQRLRMTAVHGNPEWRATDSQGKIHELPIAIELNSFDIDQYPPKLLLADNETGEALPKGRAENLVLEDGVSGGELCGWKLNIVEMMEDAAPVFTEDSVRYNAFHSTGACAAAYIKAVADGGREVEGWVSCGSCAFPMKSLKLDDGTSIVMPEREPRSYVSAVNVYTESGKSLSDTIKVNSPCRIEGWKIYQLDYDKEFGKWSERSVFEIVRDPWMPGVYAGIIMLVAGAVCMFVQFGRRKEDMQ